MTNQTQKPSTQHINQQHNTKNPEHNTPAPSVINPITQSKNQDQRLKTQISTHLCITIRGWLPAAFGGRERRTTHTTSVDLVGGGLRAVEPPAGAAGAVRGWSW
jgi:hypothetical protein